MNHGVEQPAPASVSEHISVQVTSETRAAESQLDTELERDPSCRVSFMNTIFTALLIPVALVILIGWDLLMAYPLMWAWNYAMPPVFGLKMISYWQSFSLLVVSSLLIKSTSINNKSS